MTLDQMISTLLLAIYQRMVYEALTTDLNRYDY